MISSHLALLWDAIAQTLTLHAFAAENEQSLCKLVASKSAKQNSLFAEGCRRRTQSCYEKLSILDAVGISSSDREPFRSMPIYYHALRFRATGIFASGRQRFAGKRQEVGEHQLQQHRQSLRA